MLIQCATATFAAVLSCLFTLLAVGAFNKPAPEPEPLEALQVDVSAPIAPPTAELEQLRSALSEAAAERSQVAETVIQLNRDLADLQVQVVELEIANAERLNIEALSESEQNVAPPRAENFTFRESNRRAQRQSGQERVESLIAAGVDEQTAADIQARRDQQQLARLELIDQAAREGWSESDELQQRLSELNAERVDLRDELGEDAYDRYLYESGDANRVIIASIINGSAADIAGLEVEDSIISYDNQRIFRVRELQEATRSGTKGEYVQMFFDRNGQYLSTNIPRGPLGVTLDTSSISP